MNVDFLILIINLKIYYFSAAEIQRQRKDMAYFQRWTNKWRAKLGWRANKLQKNLRRQDITF